MRRSILAILAGTVLVLSGIACSSAPAFKRTSSALAGGLTEEVMTSNTFRITTPMMEPKGEDIYIGFLPGGRLDCRQCHANEWRIKDSQTLELVSGQIVFTVLKYDPAVDALVGRSRGVVPDKIKIWIEK
jgi:hypothetical protein